MLSCFYDSHNRGYGFKIASVNIQAYYAMNEGNLSQKSYLRNFVNEATKI